MMTNEIKMIKRRNKKAIVSHPILWLSSYLGNHAVSREASFFNSSTVSCFTVDSTVTM